MNASEIVTDVLDKLSTPLIRQMGYYIDSYPEDLSQLISVIENNRFSWMLEKPYCDMQFSYGGYTSIIQIHGVVNLLHGSMFACEFIDEMAKQIKEMAEGRIQLFFDQQNEDDQRKLNHEHEMSVTV